MAYIPRGISGDETVAASGQSYDAKVGKADPILSEVDLKSDWTNFKRNNGLNVTTISTIEKFEADYGDLMTQLNKQKSLLVSLEKINN